jgi:hypothetical protein
MRGEVLFRRCAYGVVVTEDLDALMPRDDARDLGVDPRDGSKLAGPVRLMVWPRDPGGIVRLPLGGEVQVRGRQDRYAPRYRDRIGA